MAEATDSGAVGPLVDHLFRREAGRLVAILVRRFGSARLDLAEDAVQDALMKAMQSWGLTGVPDNPTAWLLQTAKNRVLDQARRHAVWSAKQSELMPLIEDCLQTALDGPAPQFEDEIRDSQLRMMFVCCQPELPPEAQVALTLKTLCGFGEREIAAAFLTSETAVAKRLVRARQFLRERVIAMELPPAEELVPRVQRVLQVLYLLFNEGYKASHGDSLLRADLCAESVRLTELLLGHPAGHRPETHALLALMLLNTARLPARVNEAGDMQLLADQDRSRWNQEQIAQGMHHLGESSTGAAVTRYHLEAGIAACHMLAPNAAATDWRRILELYDQLLALDHSPVVALNRAVALARVSGSREGLAALEAIENRRALENHHLLHAVTAQLWLEAGENANAAAGFRRAWELAPLSVERAFLEQRLAQCGE
jgi:RNA polymerase sigma factor (sigma-70 family)